MKKNGFVFVESIVVLVVVALSLTMMISSYSLIARKTKEKEYYNKASDKYLLYNINKLGTNDTCNYSDSCHITEDPTDKRNDRDFSADALNCDTTKLGRIMFDCKKVFSDFNIYKIYVVDDVARALNKQIMSSTEEYITLNNQDYYKYFDAGTIEYMKTLKRCAVTYDSTDYIEGTSIPKCSKPVKYLIGVFKRGDEYHYASIEI